MHPILAARGRILLYLAGWLPILALLVYVMWASGGISWVAAAEMLAPACIVFAFACLSPWPICRVRPLRIADSVALSLTWTVAAAAASCTLVAAAWLSAWSQGRAAVHLDLLFGIGIDAVSALRRPALRRARGRRLARRHPQRRRGPFTGPRCATLRACACRSTRTFSSIASTPLPL